MRAASDKKLHKGVELCKSQEVIFNLCRVFNDNWWVWLYFYVTLLSSLLQSYWVFTQNQSSRVFHVFPTYRVGVMPPLPGLGVDDVLRQQLPPLRRHHLDSLHHVQHLRLVHEVRQRQPGEAGTQHLIRGVLLSTPQVVSIQFPRQETTVIVRDSSSKGLNQIIYRF